MILIYAGKTTMAVYALCIDERIVYVGKSRDLVNRADAHRTKILNSDELWYPLARDFHERGHTITMKILATPSYYDLDKTEKEYIQKLKPLFNFQNMGEKGYKPMSYDVAVNKLFLGYRPPMRKYKKPQEEKNWFGEEIKFRKW